ncbi:acetoacetate decarboxylase family protein [Gordonia sp. NPDC003376]
MARTVGAVSIDRDWHLGADGVPYPPEPWYLGGDLLASAFLVPVAALPADTLDVVPVGSRPLVIGKHIVVVAAFVHYTDGGVLQYEELLTSFPVISVRHGAGVSIPHIWVTSPHSRTGGRELWGIPKHLAEFERGTDGPTVRTVMRIDGAPVASMTARPGRRVLPGTRQVPLPTAQVLGGVRSYSTNRIVGHLRTLRATWEFAPDGPLGYLGGRRRIGDLAATDAAVLFGTKVSHD